MKENESRTLSSSCRRDERRVTFFSNVSKNETNCEDAIAFNHGDSRLRAYSGKWGR